MNCAIIGREAHIAYAELESVFGDINKLNTQCVTFDDPQNKSIDINSFGSVVKFANISHQDNHTDSLQRLIEEAVLSHAKEKELSQLNFGISIYGKSIPHQSYKKLLIATKKNLAKRGVRVRFVESKNHVLNAAQIKYNQLLSKGIEVIVVYSKDKIFVGSSYAVQDVDSYSKRDFDRPCRDMKVGMFPPKLAQAMINMADIESDAVVYDPFCGSGVVMQEALLQNIKSWGSDISNKMVKCSETNLRWLKDNYPITTDYKVFEADAKQLSEVPSQTYHVITEGYLGMPLSKIPSTSEIDQYRRDISPIYIDFLKNLGSLTEPPKSIVVSLPCWAQKHQIEYLNIIDQIQDLGYTIKQFKSVQSDNIVYKRDNQIVGRQILVIRPK